MVDVKQWLEGHGLGDYSEMFAAERLRLEDLPDLTDDDLRELGLPMGPRKQLMRAAAALEGDGGSDAQAPPLPSTSGESERRQLTVMFADLVGSTALSARLDPEELRDLNRSYQDIVTSVVRRFDGFVARYMGDGVLAYFGYPQAHEDDPERAVRAGLQIADAVPDIPAEDPLSVRVGIATGEVVVGEIIGEGTASESEVVGETPNLAARLQAMAGSGEVLVAEATHALATGQFDYENLGLREVKGIAEPVQVWHALAPSGVVSRFEARGSAGITPLVGREHEMGLLLERWAQAIDGEGQVVLVTGEAGVGKSRLGEVLRDRIAADHPTRFHYQCSAYHTDSSLHPVIEQLLRVCEIRPDDPSEVALEKLAVFSSNTTEQGAHLSLLASLLSFPAGGRLPSLEMAPEQQRLATLEMLVHQIAGATQEQPGLLIFEDTHWADASSIELLGMIIERIPALRALLIITARPEFAPPWVAHSHVTQFTLGRISRRQAHELVNEVTGGKMLPEEVREQIVENSDGVPLFVEELTRTVVDSEFIEERIDHYELTGTLPQLAIPSTLHDSLMARLDRLGPARDVAQLAAVVGREFSHTLLTAVSPHSISALDDALSRLVEAGLIFRAGSADQTRYVFKHALIQQAAYGSLLKSKRRELHARVAGAIREHSGETEPDLLAYHYVEAALDEPALEYLLAAGKRAAARAAHLEAIAHLERGLALVEALPDDGERTRCEIPIRVALGVPLANTQGGGSAIVGENYERARVLCAAIGTGADTFAALWGLWYHHMCRFEVRRACEIADELIARVQDLGDEPLQLEAHHCQWASRFLRGEFDAALEHADQGLRLYRADEHHSLTLTYGGHDPGVCATDVGALALWLSGYPGRSVRRMNEALALADHLGQSSALANSINKALTLAVIRRDQNDVLQLSERLLELVSVERAEKFRAHSDAAIGWIRIERGDPASGLSLMREAVRNDLLEDPWNLHMASLIAESFICLGEEQEAWAIIEEALRRCEQNDVRWWEPEVLRVKGDLLSKAQPGDTMAVEDWYERAMNSARKRGIPLLELRSAASLARSWRGRNLHEKARGLLVPLCERFSGEADSPDLVEVRALLDETV